MRVAVRGQLGASLLMACGALALCSAPVRAQEGAVTATGTLQGTAKNEAGLPVAGVQIVIEGYVLRATTRLDGTFSLVGIPAGRIRMTARRLGYLPGRRELTVPAGGSVRVDITMRSAPLEMTPITVVARSQPSDSRLTGFRQRAENRGSGHIITRDRIEQSANRNTLDLIRSLPGVRIVQNGRGADVAQSVRFRSNRCPPLVFIDGFAATAGEFDLGSIDLHMTEGIEVYLSGATVPPEFFATSRGLEQCGVIAIWSRPAQARMLPPRRSSEAAQAAARRVAFAADSVDDIAYPIGGDPEVVYPDSLWRASIDGEVTVEFVVDDRGRLNWPSLKVVNETHPAFTRAVLEALAGVQWEAAKRGGRRVAQLVVLPVRFSRPGQGPRIGVSSGRY